MRQEPKTGRETDASVQQTLQQLSLRLQRLEAIDAIKQLKARYLMACDTKQPEQMRDCFLDGDIVIDYGPVGRFSHRDQLVDTFIEFGCHPYMLEMHHGHNPIIDITSNASAQGSWELFYQLINTKNKTITQLAIIYYDQYRSIDGEWKIVETVTKNVSTMVLDIADETPRIVTASAPPQQ